MSNRPAGATKKQFFIFMNYKDVKPLEDFDWGAIDNNSEKSNQAEIEQQAAAYEKTFNQFTEQEVIEGTIVSINDREAVVNIGFKSDGVIPADAVHAAFGSHDAGRMIVITTLADPDPHQRRHSDRDHDLILVVYGKHSGFIL